VNDASPHAGGLRLRPGRTLLDDTTARRRVRELIVVDRIELLAVLSASVAAVEVAIAECSDCEAPAFAAAVEQRLGVLIAEAQRAA
jgi:hypothetical protein